MHSRKQNGKQAPEPETAQNLPCWDGTQITAPNWLRDLESNEHLFDADVAFYLQTGCVVTNAGKTAVISPEQSALLQQDIIRKQRYNIRNPPPVDLKFKQLYGETRAACSDGCKR